MAQVQMNRGIYQNDKIKTPDAEVVIDFRINALFGDEVEFDLETKTGNLVKSNTGLITGILHLSSKVSYGVTKKGIAKKLFTPFDKKFPKFHVKTKKGQQAYDVYAVIRFEKWENNCPIATIERYVGDIGIYESENDYLRETCIKDWKNLKTVNIADYLDDCTPDRFDCTNRNIYTIDPQGCVDVDDAIHVVKKSDDLIEIGIHIADVTSYIKENSQLDLEFQKRTESVYLNTQQINMMPDVLATNECSLISGSSKRAFSIIIIVDKKGNIIEKKVTKSKITVKRNFTYEQVDSIIKKNEPCDIVEMHNMAKLLGKDETIDSHKMVEIYMILANTIVAEILGEKYPNLVLLRKHTGLVDSKHYENVPVALVNKHNIHKMQRAAYCIGLTEDAAHIGLNRKAYTHFTSPIRRYADQIVHRLLFKCITGVSESDIVHTFNVDHMNDMHKIYQDCERESTMIHTVFSFVKAGKETIETDAHIIGLDANYILVSIPELDLDYPIRLFSDRVSHLIKVTPTDNDVTIESVSDPELKVNFKLFSKLRIMVAFTLRDKKKLKLQILEPNIQELFGMQYDSE
jgi:exosome complex exonuclease DIS3/RRP44